MNDQLSEWARFFNEHAPKYMYNIFTRNTDTEVDFLLELLGIEPGNTVLDVGCGTGRHSIELARRGYTVTGLDISSGMLAEASRAAAAAAVTVQWIQSDATRFTVDKPFDAAICLCEGAFSLLGLDDDPIEHDLSILCNIRRALKTEGHFVLTALNALRKIREASHEDVKKGLFDPHSSTSVDTMTEGEVSVRVRERGYVPTELTLLLRMAGFRVLQIWGGTAGQWGRRPVDLDEIEMMAVAKRPAE